MDSVGAAVEVLGDRWALLILRDVIFADRRHFRALLLGSAEGIASNILADRLVRLTEAGILQRGTAGRGQRARYSLTEAGIQTVPIIVALAEWGSTWRPGGEDAGIPESVADLMNELRARHLATD